MYARIFSFFFHLLDFSKTTAVCGAAIYRNRIYCEDRINACNEYVQYLKNAIKKIVNCVRMIAINHATCFRIIEKLARTKFSRVSLRLFVPSYQKLNQTILHPIFFFFFFKICEEIT